MYILKIIVLGAKGVGKSTLQTAYMGREIIQKSADAGAIGSGLELQVNQNQVKFQIFGLIDEKRYNRIHELHLSGAHGILLLFDVTDKSSYQKLIDHWIPKIQDQREPTHPILLTLLGNKIDLRDPTNPSHILFDAGKQLASDLAQRFTKENIDITYFETDKHTSNQLLVIFTNVAHCLFRL